MNTIEVPTRVYELLRAGFVRHWAHWQLQAQRASGGYKPGDVVHPGDPFGTVLAWLWSTDKDETALFVAEYLADLRVHDELAGEPGARIKLDDLLISLELALPDDVDEPDAMVAWLCSRVPKYYGASDPNEP